MALLIHVGKNDKIRCYFVCFIFLCFQCATPRLQGPYKTTSASIRNCTSKEIIRPHSEFGSFIQWNAEAYNSSGKNYIRANCTILKRVENMKGPYKTTSASIRNCTSKEIIRPHSEFGSFIQWNAEAYNSSGKNYIRANCTILKRVENMKAKVRSFIWENDRWRLRLHIPGFGCQRQIFRLFIQLLHWEMNVNKCSLEKGYGIISRFDFNIFQHAWEPETYYGRWLWIFEATSNARTVACFAIETIVNPINTDS